MDYQSKSISLKQRWEQSHLKALEHIHQENSGAGVKDYKVDITTATWSNNAHIPPQHKPMLTTNFSLFKYRSSHRPVPGPSYLRFAV